MEFYCYHWHNGISLVFQECAISEKTSQIALFFWRRSAFAVVVLAPPVCSSMMTWLFVMRISSDLYWQQRLIIAMDSFMIFTRFIFSGNTPVDHVAARSLLHNIVCDLKSEKYKTKHAASADCAVFVQYGQPWSRFSLKIIDPNKPPPLLLINLSRSQRRDNNILLSS